MSKRHHVFMLALLGLCTWSAASFTAGYTGSLDTTLKVANTGSGNAVVATSSGTTAAAVMGRSTGSYSTGVHGVGGYLGMHGESSAGSGVRGSGEIGVEGFSNTGTGTQGISSDGFGVWGSSDNGAGIGAQGNTHGVYANSFTGYGVWASGPVAGVAGYSSASSGTGLSGIVSTGSGVNRGVDAYASGGSVSYGIYSTGTGATQNWAGFFDGNVHVTGTLSWVSDGRFKKNVRPMTGGLDKVMALRPKAYEMKVDEFRGRMQLAEGGQYGLIAEEVEAVLPELVIPVSAPAAQSPVDPKTGVRAASAMTSYKSVNYMALIPILLEAVQEQQKVIQAQQARLDALEALGAKGGR